MVIGINHFFSQPVSSPRDSLGNRLPELAGDVFWWLMLGKGTLFCPKKFQKPKVFPKVHFQLLSRVPHPSPYLVIWYL